MKKHYTNLSLAVLLISLYTAAFSPIAIAQGTQAPSPGVITTSPAPGTQAPSPGTISTNPTPGIQAPSPGVISTNPPSTFQLQDPLGGKFKSVGQLVSGFVEILTYLVIIVGVVLLIWTGLQFVTAMGNVERLKELKTRLLNIVIGIALVIGARVIVSVVINTLDATGTVSPGVINSANNALQGN